MEKYRQVRGLPPLEWAPPRVARGPP